MSKSTPSQSVTPAKRKFYEEPMVIVYVGKSKKPFYVHVDLLCGVSAFFKAAFAGNFKESFEKTMLLPEDNASIFKLFVDWLYHERYEMLPEVESDDYDDDSDEEEDDDEEVVVDSMDEEEGGEGDRFLQAFQLFVLADKFEVPKLKNLVIETLFSVGGVCSRGPVLPSIAYAYEHTVQGSALRKVLADWHTWKIDLEWYEDPEIQAFLRQQPDFATDLNVSFAKYLKKGKNQSYNPFKGVMPEEYKDKNHVQEIRALRRQPEEPPQGPTDVD